jgi:hypothetical protein
MTLRSTAQSISSHFRQQAGSFAPKPSWLQSQANFGLGHRHRDMGNRFWRWSSWSRGRTYQETIQVLKWRTRANRHRSLVSIYLPFSPACECRDIIGSRHGHWQLASVPPNVRFIIDDIHEDWSFSEPFDYIHSRMMNFSIPDWLEYFRKIYE